MTSALDMSLDDLIKTNKQVGRGGGRGGKASTRRGASNASAGAGYSGGKTSGPARRQTNRTSARPNPYATAKSIRRAPDTTWQHDLFEDGAGAGVAPGGGRSMGIETGTKLYISNLDYGVSNDDIKELFSEVGDLKRCAIHYDRSGRSKGTAEVVFSRRADAVAALKRYNNVQLDAKPMKIELIGTNLTTVGPPRVANGAVMATGGRGRTVVMTASNRGGRGVPGGGRRGSFRGRGRGRGNPGRGKGGSTVEKTAEDLDAELESYHAEAMQTS